jgi:hypothetical protein
LDQHSVPPVGYQTEFTDITADAGAFTSVDLTGFLAGALTLVGKSVINNSDIDVMTFIVNEMSKKIALFLEDELLNGTTDKATGALATTTTLNAGSISAITADNLIDLQAKIKTAFQANACWTMAPATFTAIKKLKYADGKYILQENVTGDFPYLLLGKKRGEEMITLPLEPSAHAPAVQEVRVEGIGDVVDLCQGYPRLPEAVVDGVEGQLPRGERDRALAVLDLREALLLSRGDDPPVPDETGGGVVKSGVDAQRVHALSCLRLRRRHHRRGEAVRDPFAEQLVGGLHHGVRRDSVEAVVVSLRADAFVTVLAGNVEGQDPARHAPRSVLGIRQRVDVDDLHARGSGDVDRTRVVLDQERRQRDQGGELGEVQLPGK